MATEATSIEFIPNQPILFDYKELACHRFLDDGYCQLYQFEDDIWWQGIRRPCGENLVCDMDDETLGAELVTNSDLSAAGSWTATNTVIGGGVCAFTGVANQYLSQSVAVSASTQYRITYEVSSYTQGTLRSNILGDITAAGTYTGLVNTVAGQTSITVLFWGNVTGETDFVGDITLVSIKEVQKCLSGTGWSYSEDDGYFYHEAGELDPLTPLSTPILTGQTYKIKVSIKLATAGDITITAGDESYIMSANGQDSFYLYTGGSTTFQITPSIDFDGAIKVDEIYGMTEIEEAYLTDVNGTEIVSIIEYVTYYQDRINLRFKWSELLEAHEGEDLGIEAGGCYRIALYDYCNPQFQELMPNNELVGGSSLIAPSDYGYLTTGGIVTWTGDVFDANVTLAGQSPRFYNLTPIYLEDGKNYRATIVVNSVDPGCRISMMFDNGVYVAGPFTAPGTYTMDITGYNTGAFVDGKLTVFVLDDGGPYPAQGIIESVSLKRIEPFDQEFLSNCFKVQETIDCSEYIQAYNDCSAFGFNFNGFRLGMRIPVMMFNPTFPFKDNTYIYSSGEKSRTYSERDKKYTFKTDKMDDIAHSSFSLMLLCDHFFIGADEYYFDEKDYNPTWNNNGRQSVAPVRIELSEKTSVVYNNACDVCTTPISTGGECAEYCETVVGIYNGSPGTTVGYYLVENDQLLEYWNGSAWIGNERACDAIALLDDGVTQTPYYWNGVRWVIWAEIVSATNSGTDLSVSATLPTGSYGRLQVSTDGGVTWSNLGVYRSAAIWLAGTDVYTSPLAPPNAIDLRIMFNVDGCTYYTAVANYTLT